MNKNDGLDLILKAAAVYLFVLAVATLPSVVGALIHIGILSRSVLSAITGEASLGETLAATSISTSVTGVLKFVLFIVVGRNLFNGGSWLKRIMRKKDTTQPEDRQVSSESALSDEQSS